MARASSSLGISHRLQAFAEGFRNEDRVSNLFETVINLCTELVVPGRVARLDGHMQRGLAGILPSTERGLIQQHLSTR